MALRDFLWSKFWIGLAPVLVLTEALTLMANYLLGVDRFLALLSPLVVLLMSVALVGLATGLGARYPRFAADNASQVAGSYGGIAFMVMAVLFVLSIVALIGWPSSVYLFHQARHIPVSARQWSEIYRMLHRGRRAQHRGRGGLGCRRVFGLSLSWNRTSGSTRFHEVLRGSTRFEVRLRSPEPGRTS